MGTHEIRMKLIATLVAAASASQYFGTRDDGVQWSAVLTESAMAYQEAGESIVAMVGDETTDSGLGMHTLCYDDSVMPGLPEGVPQCKTVAVRYSSWNWDGTTLTAAGMDDMGPFTIKDGKVVGDQTVFKKVWIGGPMAGLEGTVALDAVPNNYGLLWGPFTLTTNTGTFGGGRFAVAFVENAQFSFEDTDS